MTAETEMDEIYYGDRDVSFKNIITNVLKKSNLKSKYLEILLSEDSLTKYSDVFTSSSVDPINNYEIYEQLGDMTANKFIVWYAYERFPCLKTTEGVKIVARLRINYGARASFQKIGEDLDFWDLITATVEERSRKKKDLLEDCFEAFIGCTEMILDTHYMPGVGYNIVYSMLKNIFNKIPMYLSYNKLYDAKTRLKELFDINMTVIGTWKFIEDPRTKEDTICTSRVYQIPTTSQNKNPITVKQPGNDSRTISQPRPDWLCIGEGVSCKKGDAQQKAAQNALNTLYRNGFVKEIHSHYLEFEKAPNQESWN
jgi:dsRNA-specific ribonuclease